MKQSLLKWDFHIYFIIFCSAYSCIIVLYLGSVSVWSLPHTENVEGRMNHKYMSLNGSLALLLFLLRLFLLIVVLSFHPLSEVIIYLFFFSLRCQLLTPALFQPPLSLLSHVLVLSFVIPLPSSLILLILQSLKYFLLFFFSSLFIFLQLHFYWGNLFWLQIRSTVWNEGRFL